MEQTRRFTVALGRNAVEYAELIIALGIAAYFAYRSAAGDVTVQTLVQATGGILAVLAIAMVRERHERVAVALEVREAARSISGPSKPWRVLDAKFTWKLHDERGEQATGFARKEIRIEHDDVYSLYGGLLRTSGSNGRGSRLPPFPWPNWDAPAVAGVSATP